MLRDLFLERLVDQTIVASLNMAFKRTQSESAQPQVVICFGVARSGKNGLSARRRAGRVGANAPHLADGVTKRGER